MSEEDEEVLFDRSGDLITDEEHLLPDAESGLVNGLDLDTINVQPNVTLAPTRGRVFQTICLCAAFFGLVCTNDALVIICYNSQQSLIMNHAGHVNVKN